MINAEKLKGVAEIAVALIIALVVLKVVSKLTEGSFGAMPDLFSGAAGKNFRKQNISPSEAGGTFPCLCTDKFGNTRWIRGCRRTKHESCDSCCGHYGSIEATGDF